MKIRIALTDDHLMILNGLKSMLLHYPHLELIACYQSGAALLEGLEKDQPDVLLLDLQLPDRTGDELTRIISRKYPDTRIVILTSHDSVFLIKTLMNNGASGYLLKTADPELLLQAIETVYEGKKFLPEELKDRILNDSLKLKNNIADLNDLTAREKDILKLIAEECTSTEIAQKLNLSTRTVENYRLGLMQKLDARNMIGLVKKAIQLGLLE